MIFLKFIFVHFLTDDDTSCQDGVQSCYAKPSLRGNYSNVISFINSRLKVEPLPSEAEIFLSEKIDPKIV